MSGHGQRRGIYITASFGMGECMGSSSKSSTHVHNENVQPVPYGTKCEMIYQKKDLIFSPYLSVPAIL